MRQEGDPALEPRAPEALTEGSEPGAATERSAKPHKKTVRKTRERTRNYAVISRQKRERPTYAAARERQGPAYSTVTENGELVLSSVRLLNPFAGLAIGRTLRG
ncbi:MAG: hypothetical protein ACXWVL_07060 [Rhodoplanes sp.]